MSGEVLNKILPGLIPETIQIFLNKNGIERALDFSRKYNYSVVLKPKDANLGKGIHICPKSDQEVEQIRQTLFQKYEDVLVQKFLSSKSEYRVVYVNGKFFDAVKRIPAFCW